MRERSTWWMNVMLGLLFALVGAGVLAGCGATPAPVAHEPRDPPRVATNDPPSEAPQPDAGGAAPPVDGPLAPAEEPAVVAAPVVVAAAPLDCAALVDKLIALMARELGPGMKSQFLGERDRMVAECTIRPPSDEERACLMAAEKMNDILGCLESRR